MVESKIISPKFLQRFALTAVVSLHLMQSSWLFRTAHSQSDLELSLVWSSKTSLWQNGTSKLKLWRAWLAISAIKLLLTLSSSHSTLKRQKLFGNDFSVINQSIAKDRDDILTFFASFLIWMKTLHDWSDAMWFFSRRKC